MREIPLTPEEQIFAAEHHSLVYTFLKEKNLSFEEYYDVIVFGYLKAVRYCSATTYSGPYPFANIAWKFMQNFLYNYNRSRNCQKHTAQVISLHTLTGEDDLPSEENIPAADRLMQQLEAELLLHDLAKHVSEQQMEIVRLKSSGYNLKDIATCQNTSTKRIRKLLEEVRCVLTELCCQ